MQTPGTHTLPSGKTPSSKSPLEILYADRLVSVTRDSITFYRYSFPFLGKRTVALSDIDYIAIREPSLANGRWRIWGSGNLRTWFPFDLHRSSRDRIFVAFLKTRGMNIGFTVEDSARVLAVFRECGLIERSAAV
jgi:hypothetical protein